MVSSILIASIILCKMIHHCPPLDAWYRSEEMPPGRGRYTEAGILELSVAIGRLGPVGTFRPQSREWCLRAAMNQVARLRDSMANFSTMTYVPPHVPATPPCHYV